MTDSHWRNILHHHDEPDEAMQRIDAQVAPLEELPDVVRHIRALISRFDSLTHYCAFDNLDLLVRAIGEGDYSGRPAVDVLTPGLGNGRPAAGPGQSLCADAASVV